MSPKTSCILSSNSSSGIFPREDLHGRKIPRAPDKWRMSKGQATLCVQSAEYRTRSSYIAFLRTVLVWLSTYIPYQLNIVSDYAITQYRTNASDIAHLVRIVCSGLKIMMHCNTECLLSGVLLWCWWAGVCMCLDRGAPGSGAAGGLPQSADRRPRTPAGHRHRTPHPHIQIATLPGADWWVPVSPSRRSLWPLSSVRPSFPISQTSTPPPVPTTLAQPPWPQSPGPVYEWMGCRSQDIQKAGKGRSRSGQGH